MPERSEKAKRFQRPGKKILDKSFLFGILCEKGHKVCDYRYNL